MDLVIFPTRGNIFAVASLERKKQKGDNVFQCTIVGRWNQ
jgi:hypothetical protein